MFALIVIFQKHFQSLLTKRILFQMSSTSSYFENDFFFPLCHDVLPVPKPNTSLSSDVLFCFSNQHQSSFFFFTCLSCRTTFIWTICLLLSLFCFPFPFLHPGCLVEGEEEMKITLLQRKRNQLAGYCKLVIYGVLDLTAATDVFKHYSKVVGWRWELYAIVNFYWSSMLCIHYKHIY